MNGPVIADLRSDESADVVLSRAHERASDLRVPLVVCNTVARAAKQLSHLDEEAIARRICARTGRPRADFTLVHPLGDPVTCLAELSERLEPSLIVTGPGLAAMLVTRYVDGPILIARARRGDAVLGATDFSDPSLPALTAALQEAARHGRPLRFFHAINRETQQRQSDLSEDELVDDIKVQLRAYAREHNMRAEVFAVPGEAATELTRAARQSDVDLVVLARRRRRRLGRYFQPTTADLTITGVPCSVLLVSKK